MIQDRLNIFEKVLLLYGQEVLLNLYSSAKVTERYEDCAIMRDLLKKYNVDERDDIQDWQAELWRCGYAGKIAAINFPYYMHEAVKMVGYTR